MALSPTTSTRLRRFLPCTPRPLQSETAESGPAMADESAPKLTASYNTLGSRQAFLLRKKRTPGTFKSLTALSLNVDEQTSLARCLERHLAIKWHKSLGVSPQLPPSHMDR